MKTELVWEGKYDEFGNLREFDFAGLAMPLHRVKTIDEPRLCRGRYTELQDFSTNGKCEEMRD